MIKNNKILFSLYLFIGLIGFFYIFNNFTERAGGQTQTGGQGNSRVDNFNIKLEVFQEPNYSALGSTTSAGAGNINTSNYFNKFYNVEPKISVVANTFYRLILEGVGSESFNLTFKRFEPLPTSTINFNNVLCNDLGGRLENNNCIIEGMFTTTTNNSYEIWRISLIKSGASSHTYFYLATKETAQDSVSNQRDQYYIIPTSTNVTLTNSNPLALIDYSFYYKKLYCYEKLAEGVITSTPSSMGLSWSNGNSISYSDFVGGIISLTRTLSINSTTASGAYNIFVLKRGGQNQISFNTVTLRVNNQISNQGGQPPPLSIQSCFSTSTVSNEIYATYTIMISQNASGTLPYTYLISVKQTVDNTIFISSSSPSTTALVWHFPFILTPTGTYRAFATVTDSAEPQQYTTSTCEGIICGCVYLYRAEAGITTGWYRKCRLADNWTIVAPTTTFPYANDDRINCICRRNSTDTRCFIR